MLHEAMLLEATCYLRLIMLQMLLEATHATWGYTLRYLRLHATCWGYMLTWCLLKELIEPTSPFATMPQEPWHPGKGAKLDYIVQLNCGEVHIHASYKTIRTWENFNKWGKRSYLKKSGVRTQEKREVEVDTLLLGNYKNNVIPNNVLSYF